MSSYTIKDLEQISGIKAHTIRIWEQRYSFLQPQRTETNIRSYSADELKVILNVSLLNKYGFKISHIDKMSTADMEEKIMGLNQLDAEKERVVNALIKDMVSLNMQSFERQLDSYIAQKGIEKTITEIIFSFLERVGILWITNHINPAQEHLSSNIIRQKIILGIEKLPKLYHANTHVVLFMPEGEYHEVGLLFVHFLLKQKGISVDYLGANVPTVDIKYLTQQKRVDYLYTHITAPIKGFKMNKFLEQLTQIDPKIPIVITGQMAQEYKGTIAAPIQIKRTLGATMEFLSSL
jgi:DNA-binding transcriptional MerR regulator/methylmalonyl-CoA mutase cobalamin-binding subunit